MIRLIVGIGALLNVMTAWGVEVKMSGTLTFISENEVRELNLSSLSRRVLYRHSIALRNEISKVNEAEFVASSLLGDLHLIRTNGLSVNLGKGIYPVYVNKHKTLLFYASRSNSGKFETNLIAAKLEGGRLIGAKEIMALSLGPFPPVAVSDDEIVFPSQINGTWKLFSYDVSMDKVKSLPIEGCWPVAWRNVAQELICSYGKNTWAISLDGEIRKELPELNDMSIGPISNNGQFLLGGRGRFSFFHGDVWDLMVFDFQNKKISKVAEHVPLPSGTGLWAE